MNSETRTKITSWLRSPKSLAAKAGIGLAAVAVVSVGTVSAMTVANINKEPETAQNSAVVAENVPITPESTKKPQESPKTEENQPSSVQDDDTDVIISASDTDVTPKPSEPVAPAPTVYTDSYPVDLRDAPISSKVDQWGFSNRQSTSYTAWKVSEAGKNVPKWGYMGKGDANMWVANARSAGITVNGTPKVGAVAVSANFTAYVEAVNGDKIDVSFYNWGNNGAFGHWNDVQASQFADYIHF